MTIPVRHPAKPYDRVAGLAYLLTTTAALLTWILVDSVLLDPDSVRQSVLNIASHQDLFRAGLVGDLVMFAADVLLIVSLYITVRSVDNNLALLGLLWRSGAITLGTVAVLMAFIALDVVGGDAAPALGALFLMARESAYVLVVVFISLGSLVFSYLFFKSNLVPQGLSAFGLLAYAILLAGGLATLFLPQYAAQIQLSYALALAYELIMGLWLLILGINTRAQVKS